MIDLVYFGTSDHSVILLNSFKKSGEINLKLVVTKPDKPVGRKQEILPSPVKKWCMEQNISFITPSSFKKELETVKSEIRETKTEIALVADYGMIIPKEIIDLFPKGIINIHFSLLPKYRGASPVTYTILNGDKKTGITYQVMSVGMDKGNIIKQFEYEITEDETDESLYRKLFLLAAKETPEVLKDYLLGKLKLVKQNESEATYTTPSGKFDRTTFVFKDDAKLDLTRSDEEIERAIRAFYPWPVAWTTLKELSSYLKLELRDPKQEDLKVKIHKATLTNEKLEIKEAQVEGGRTIRFADFLHGYFNKIASPPAGGSQ